MNEGDRSMKLIDLCKPFCIEILINGSWSKEIPDDVKISIEQWLSMFKNASHIMTDSFHGMVFSIIYHKNFSCFINSER